MIGVIFTDKQAPGAWPNGATVRKINSLKGDATPNGTTGTIIGSIDVRSMNKGSTYGYFVAWMTAPPFPVFVVDRNANGKPRLKLELDA